MTMLIKICGLSTPETLDAALGAGADMIGLVFHAASPRFVGTGHARTLRERVAGRAEIVALTVDADDAVLEEIVSAVRPDWLQLHGAESPDRVRDLAARFGLRTIKSVAIRGRADVPAADAYRGVADMILFDAKPPIGSVLPGGNGVPFNWRLLRGVEPPRPFMLSGGLNPGNVAEAFVMTAPDAVDVSSGVETAPGRKDPDLIRAFIAAARIAAIAPAEALS